MMSINTDYAQLQEWGKLNPNPPKVDVKPIDKVVNEVFKPIIVNPEQNNDK